jgi:hypothetical protein
VNSIRSPVPRSGSTAAGAPTPAHTRGTPRPPPPRSSAHGCDFKLSSAVSAEQQRRGARRPLWSALWGRDEGTRGEALWPTGVPPLQTKGALSLPTNIDRHTANARLLCVLRVPSVLHTNWRFLTFGTITPFYCMTSKDSPPQVSYRKPVVASPACSSTRTVLLCQM